MRKNNCHEDFCIAVTWQLAVRQFYLASRWGIEEALLKKWNIPLCVYDLLELLMGGRGLMGQGRCIVSNNLDCLLLLEWLIWICTPVWEAEPECPCRGGAQPPDGLVCNQLPVVMFVQHICSRVTHFWFSVVQPEAVTKAFKEFADEVCAFCLLSAKWFPELYDPGVLGDTRDTGGSCLKCSPRSYQLASAVCTNL